MSENSDKPYKITIYLNVAHRAASIPIFAYRNSIKIFNCTKKYEKINENHQKSSANF